MAEIRHKIRELRDEKNLTRSEFADIIDEKPSKIADIESGKQRVNEAFIRKILEKFPISLSWLFGLDESALTPAQTSAIMIQSYDLPMSAGTGSMMFEEPASDSFAISSMWLEKTGLNPKHLCVFPVRGDSMERELCNGDLIIVDRSQNFAEDGGTYALRVDNEMLVKKIQILPGRILRLHSNNTLYSHVDIAPELADQSVSIIGRVVSSLRQW